jgi:hypothetical protein
MWLYRWLRRFGGGLSEALAAGVLGDEARPDAIRRPGPEAQKVNARPPKMLAGQNARSRS